MENPFCYIPFTAKRLKDMDKGSKAYKKLMKFACRNSLFYTRLSECLIRDSENEKTKAIRKQIINDTRMMLLFLNIAIFAGLAATGGILLMRDSFFGRNAVYIYAAALCTLPFVLYYVSHSNALTVRMAEKYLEDYKLPDERFTEQRIAELILVKATTKDVIHTSELEKDIPCGCYNCRSKFKSSELKIVELSEEYVCPCCGETTVISERCGAEITDELLQDLHDYWIGCDEDNPDAE